MEAALDVDWGIDALGGPALPRSSCVVEYECYSVVRRTTVVSVNAGHTWQAVDYADGLVRVGVQPAIVRPETGALIRKLIAERGMPFPPVNRTVYSVCIVELCKERVPNGDPPQK